jgi:hypothetical protein
LQVLPAAQPSHAPDVELVDCERSLALANDRRGGKQQWQPSSKYPLYKRRYLPSQG